MGLVVEAATDLQIGDDPILTRCYASLGKPVWRNGVTSRDHKGVQVKSIREKQEEWEMAESGCCTGSGN